MASRGTPIFTVRLAPKVQADLALLGRIYGSPNPRAFAREVLEVICSSDPERVKAFNVRLFSKVGEQLALKFSQPLDVMKAAKEEAERPKVRRKKPGRGGKRARP
jgi:hypothetical protein